MTLPLERKIGIFDSRSKTDCGATAVSVREVAHAVPAGCGGGRGSRVSARLFGTPPTVKGQARGAGVGPGAGRGGWRLQRRPSALGDPPQVSRQATTDGPWSDKHGPPAPPDLRRGGHLAVGEFPDTDRGTAGLRYETVPGSSALRQSVTRELDTDQGERPSPFRPLPPSVPRTESSSDDTASINGTDATS